MRLLSLAPSNTEILFALGCGKDIIAVTRFCNYPEEALKKPKVGGWLDVKMELVQRYQPELVLTSSFLQEKIAAQLKEAGYAVLHVDPKTLADIPESIRIIGKAVGAAEKAEHLVRYMEKQLSILREKTARLQKIPVYCEEWHKPPTIAGNWVPELIEITGGTQNILKAGERSREAQLAELQRLQPHRIILHWCGFGEKSNTTNVMTRSGWQTLPAVAHKQIFCIDDALLNRPGPRLVHGAKALAVLLHPEL